jgi:hypothetical protein
MRTPDPSDRHEIAENDAAALDDVTEEWLFDSSAGIEPMFFDTSVHIDAVFFETNAQQVLGNEVANGCGNTAIAGVPGWDAYRRHVYSVWRFDGLGWQVVASGCSNGAICGSPPREAGQYVSERRKKSCEPAGAAVEHSTPQR